MTTDTEKPAEGAVEELGFRAEVQQVLQILAHSLYSDREIFLRELISNASDAIHRLQFHMLTDSDVLDAEAEPEIRISVDEEQHTISISDNGIGMTRPEMVEHLGTIAQSSARVLLQSLEAGQRGNIIGQFGVGFYSVFTVADEVTVVSRSARKDAEAALWRSTGGATFEVGTAERAARGTTVTLKLKEDAREFASTWRLEQIVKKHSEFVAFPIFMGDRQINAQTAIWRRQPREVTQDDYNAFYRQLTYDFEPPLTQLHLSTDAPIDLHALLFVPARRERGLIEQRVEGKIKLYSRKILIQEEAKELLPNHFRFVEGVVDSEDLPLNVSRETVQNSPAMQKIRKTLAGRMLKELNELSEKDAPKYATFWREFGPFIKEGIAVDAASRDDLTKLLRFHSSTQGDELITLDSYVERMGEEQEEIYYLLAENMEAARQSPHLEPLAARGLEALLLTDVIDGFMLNGLSEYKGKKLRAVDDADLVLPGDDAAGDELVSGEQFDALALKAKQVLGERITEVRASKVLRDSPARLVVPDDDAGRNMQRINKLLGRAGEAPKKIFELNKRHPLVAGLARMAQERPDDALLEAAIEQLYDSGLLLEGLHPNPASMVGRMQQILAAAVQRDVL
jgi:HSP90 family molecular chaperone